jgi:hypothetical protein
MELHEEFRLWSLINKAENIKFMIRTQQNPIFSFVLKLLYYRSFMNTCRDIQDCFWCGDEISVSKIDQLPSCVRRDYFFQ